MPITMYGTYWCSDCKRTKQFFGEHRVDYDFVDIDQDPAGLAEVERGFIVTGPNLETSVPGIFAAGDCRRGSTKQAASAAGEGAAVALGIRQYLEPRVQNPAEMATAAD
jgi:thioredoxin reductase